MQSLNLSVEHKFQKLETRLDLNDIRVSKLEEIITSRSMTTGNDLVTKEIEALKSEIASLKEKPGETNGKETTERCKTAIFGGFSSYKDFEGVKTWAKDMFWENWLPQPAEVYHKKGDFAGMFFCRFDTVVERNKVVDCFRRLSLKIESEKVWSAEDLPIDIRVPEHFLFGVKKLLGSQTWGYTLGNLWVNKKTKSISLGREEILSVTLEDSELKLTYGAFWEAHIGGDPDFKHLLKTEQEKLDRSSKGKGTGKTGKAGKVPVPASQS